MRLNNAREFAESHADYRARRLSEHRQVREHAKGRVVFPACEIVALPAKGVDEKADEAVRRGEIRDVVDVLLKDGTPTRIVRTKGVPYRRYPAQPGMRRSMWRERRILL